MLRFFDSDCTTKFIMHHIDNSYKIEIVWRLLYFKTFLIKNQCYLTVFEILEFRTQSNLLSLQPKK
jgi:hypothetical protein